MLRLALLALLMSGPAAAVLTLDGTRARSNAVCYINGKRLEIFLRSQFTSRFSDPSENGSGEYVFYTSGERKDAKHLPELKPYDYRFFKGENSLCARTMAFMVNKKLLAVLLTKENSPQKDKLLIQLFDAKTLEPKKLFETDYPCDAVASFENGFAFINHIDRESDSEMGKVNFDGDDYVYQDRTFSEWITFDGEKFQVNPQLTFKNSPLKDFFKNEAEFLSVSGWNPIKKQFSNQIIYVAVNYGIKKQCLLMSNVKLTLTGKEKWVCRQL